MKIRQKLQAIKRRSPSIRRNWLNMAALQCCTTYLDGSKVYLHSSLKSRRWSFQRALIHLVRINIKTYWEMQIKQKPFPMAKKHARPPGALLCNLNQGAVMPQALRNSHNTFKAIKRYRAMPDLVEVPAMPSRLRRLMLTKLSF